MGSYSMDELQILGWAKSSFKFFLTSYGKPKQSFWPTQYITLRERSMITYSVIPFTLSRILRCSAFSMVQLTSIHDYWKNHSFD